MRSISRRGGARGVRLLRRPWATSATREAPAALTAEDVLKLIRAELPGMLREALAEVLAPATGTTELALKDSGACADNSGHRAYPAADGGQRDTQPVAVGVGPDGRGVRTVMRNLQVLRRPGGLGGCARTRIVPGRSMSDGLRRDDSGHEGEVIGPRPG